MQFLYHVADNSSGIIIASVQNHSLQIAIAGGNNSLQEQNILVMFKKLYGTVARKKIEGLRRMGFVIIGHYNFEHHLLAPSCCGPKQTRLREKWFPSSFAGPSLEIF